MDADSAPTPPIEFLAPTFSAWTADKRYRRQAWATISFVPAKRTYLGVVKATLSFSPGGAGCIGSGTASQRFSSGSTVGPRLAKKDGEKTIEEESLTGRGGHKQDHEPVDPKTKSAPSSDDSSFDADEFFYPPAPSRRHHLRNKGITAAPIPSSMPSSGIATPSSQSQPGYDRTALLPVKNEKHAGSKCRRSWRRSTASCAGRTGGSCGSACMHEILRFRAMGGFSDRNKEVTREAEGPGRKRVKCRFGLTEKRMKELEGVMARIQEDVDVAVVAEAAVAARYGKRKREEGREEDEVDQRKRGKALGDDNSKSGPSDPSNTQSKPDINTTKSSSQSSANPAEPSLPADNHPKENRRGVGPESTNAQQENTAEHNKVIPTEPKPKRYSIPTSNTRWGWSWHKPPEAQRVPGVKTRSSGSASSVHSAIARPPPVTGNHSEGDQGRSLKPTTPTPDNPTASTGQRILAGLSNLLSSAQNVASHTLGFGVRSQDTPLSTVQNQDDSAASLAVRTDTEPTENDTTKKDPAESDPTLPTTPKRRRRSRLERLRDPADSLIRSVDIQPTNQPEPKKGELKENNRPEAQRVRNLETDFHSDSSDSDDLDRRVLSANKLFAPNTVLGDSQDEIIIKKRFGSSTATSRAGSNALSTGNGVWEPTVFEGVGLNKPSDGLKKSLPGREALRKESPKEGPSGREMKPPQLILPSAVSVKQPRRSLTMEKTSPEGKLNGRATVPWNEESFLKRCEGDGTSREAPSKKTSEKESLEGKSDGDTTVSFDLDDVGTSAINPQSLNLERKSDGDTTVSFDLDDVGTSAMKTQSLKHLELEGEDKFSRTPTKSVLGKELLEGQSSHEVRTSPLRYQIYPHLSELWTPGKDFPEEKSDSDTTVSWDDMNVNKNDKILGQPARQTPAPKGDSRQGKPDGETVSWDDNVNKADAEPSAPKGEKINKSSETPKKTAKENRESLEGPGYRRTRSPSSLLHSQRLAEYVRQRHSTLEELREEQPDSDTTVSRVDGINKDAQPLGQGDRVGRTLSVVFEIPSPPPPSPSSPNRYEDSDGPDFYTRLPMIRGRARQPCVAHKPTEGRDGIRDKQNYLYLLLLKYPPPPRLSPSQQTFSPDGSVSPTDSVSTLSPPLPSHRFNPNYPS